MIKAEAITLIRSNRIILDDVSLEVPAGETTVIVGPNGAGKTTLIDILTGRTLPDRGSVFLEGKAIGKYAFHELARRRAVLSQKIELSFAFTVLEVVLLGRIPHTRLLETRQDIDIARQSLALVDAADLADRAYTTLSGGEKQRVQLARVLAQIWEEYNDHARFLFLDEPTSGLDLSHAFSIMETISAFSARGTTVLVVLHDLDLTLQFADHVVLMDSGRVLKYGKPKDVLRPDTIRHVFGVHARIVAHPEADRPHLILEPLTGSEN